MLNITSIGNVFSHNYMFRSGFLGTFSGRRVVLSTSILVGINFRQLSIFDSKKALLNSRATYIQFNETTASEKAQRIFNYVLKQTLAKFELEVATNNSQEQWNLLQNHLRTSHSFLLPSLDRQSLINNTQVLLNIIRPPLIKEGQIPLRFSQSDYIANFSDYMWGNAEVGIPFTRKHKKIKTDLLTIQYILDQCPNPMALPQNHDKLGIIEQKIQSCSLLNDEKDATAAILLATPYIDDNTFFHELGCWNGQNLINLLFYASLKDRYPKYCLGTDINAQALSMAESLSSLFSLDSLFVGYYLANGLDSFDADFFKLEYLKTVKLALRVIPVLYPSQALTFLKNIRDSLRTKNDVVIVSYATPYGETYERNLVSAQAVTDVDFPGVTTFLSTLPEEQVAKFPKYLQEQKDHRVVLNSYYDKLGFSNLVQMSGFKILSTILTKCDKNNERVVATLAPQ